MPVLTMPILDACHRPYFTERAFTEEHIETLKSWGVRSISKAEALALGIKKYDGERRTHLSDGGIWMPFTPTYGQIRFNQPLVTVKGETFKYLSPRTPAKAWVPPVCNGWHEVQAITEGWADAAAPTVRGIPTAAIVGVYNVIYSVPQGCKVAMIYDSDGWQKPQVVRALLLGSLWTGGKINLFPEMEQFPAGGGCEFFKAGYSVADYQALIQDAYKPVDFLQAWIERFPTMDATTRGKALWVASEAIGWLNQPGHMAESLLMQRDDKLEATKRVKGLSVEHVPNSDKFLDDAVEVA
jgi:hypothetical protein